MKREFTLIVDGIEYPVAAEGSTVTVNGRPFAVEVAADGTVLVDGIAYEVTLEADTATVDGKPYSVQVSGLTALAISAAAPGGGREVRAFSVPSAGAVGAGAVLAIMPGKIVRVLVEPGQKVQEGAPVCVLEAMKMENELHARQSGVVRLVHVQPGDDVEKDQILIEIE